MIHKILSKNKRLSGHREYPVAPERSGKPADLANYVSFLRNLKNALGSGGHKYGLTITIPSSFWYMQNFDIIAISKIIDWFNVMSYDLHGINTYAPRRSQDSENDRNMGFNQPLYWPYCGCSHEPDRDRLDNGSPLAQQHRYSTISISGSALLL